MLFRSVRNTDGGSSHNSGGVEYEGVIWDCNVLQNLGESGSISPELCLVFQGKAEVNCPCNAYKTRDEVRAPKLKSGARISQHAFSIGVVLFSALVNCLN